VNNNPIKIFTFDPALVKIENLIFDSKTNKPFSFDINASKAGEGFIRVNIKGSLFEFSF